MVKSSVFYPDIQDRYESFSYENLTTLTYTDAVINFNPKVIKSKIKSDYLLFEEKVIRDIIIWELLLTKIQEKDT